MVLPDEPPVRVTATPAAFAQLAALAASRGDVTVMLTDDRVQVLPAGQDAPQGAVRLGRLLAESVTFAADPQAHTAWWRTRAVIDLRSPSGSTPDFTVETAPLDDAEVFEAIASGPLPRF